MRRIGLGLLLVLGLAGLATAEEPAPAVLNEPSLAATTTKDMVNTTAPTAEVVYNIGQDRWDVGLSASLYNFTSHQIHLGRVKSGYLSSNTPYAGLDVDLPGVLTRYVAGWAPALDDALQPVAKYSAVGLIVGYDVEGDELAYGPSFGATLRF